MSKEFMPLYNKDGQVEDPEIARKMAKDQEILRELVKRDTPTEKAAYIAKQVEETGLRVHDEEMKEVVISKIRAALSPEEIAIIKRMSEDQTGSRQSSIRNFFDLITKQ